VTVPWSGFYRLQLYEDYTEGNILYLLSTDYIHAENLKTRPPPVVPVKPKTTQKVQKTTQQNQKTAPNMVENDKVTAETKTHQPAERPKETPE